MCGEGEVVVSMELHGNQIGQCAKFLARVHVFPFLQVHLSIRTNLVGLLECACNGRTKEGALKLRE